MAITNAELKQNTFTRIKKFITIEPILLAFGIPLYLQSIAIQNLALEKSCRVNLQLSTEVCDSMIDKSINGIHCGNLTVTLETLNETSTQLENAHKTFYNVTTSAPDSHFSLEQKVCRAEIESQKLISTFSGYTAPLESVIGIVVILIGGYWSDVSGRRKPLILYPIFGEFLIQLVYLIGAFFMTELPFEFVAILASLIGALTGGYSLLYMGLLCYVTEITSEKDRVFRIGLLYQMYPFMAMCILPFSGMLYKQLGYINLFVISVIFQASGILYVILLLKEPKVFLGESSCTAEKSSTNQIDSGLEHNDSNTSHASADKQSGDILESSHGSMKTKIVETLRNIINVLTRPRNGNTRMVIWLLLLSNFVLVGCEYEIANEYFFVRTKLNWEALEESPFAAYSSGTAFFGNILMTAVFSKYFKMSDAVIGLISSTCATIAKFICITVSTTLMLYVARTFDMFALSGDAANQCILSKIVNQNEIGQIFSLLSLVDNLSLLIFVPIYTNVYIQTVDAFPNAYFIISFGGMALVASIFGDICGIQNTFSLNFFIQITSSAICICSVTYLLASEHVTNNYNNFVMYISLMGIYNYEISQLMYYGNEITLASEQLMDSVYHSNWMDLSIIYRKLMLIFMERLKKPHKMLIGKVFPLDLKLLTSILNVAYTFFNVLRSNEQGKSSYKSS